MKDFSTIIKSKLSGPVLTSNKEWKALVARFRMPSQDQNHEKDLTQHSKVDSTLPTLLNQQK